MTSTSSLAKACRVRTATVVGLVALATAMLPMVVRAQFLHPKISKESTIHKVVILPAKVSVVRDSMKGPEGMSAESEELSARVEQAVAEVLLQKHVTALSAPASSSAEAGAQQKYTVADIQAKFDDLLPKVMKKRSDVKKGRFSM